jgi:hypothetical protein
MMINTVVIFATISAITERRIIMIKSTDINERISVIAQARSLYE